MNKKSKSKYSGRGGWLLNHIASKYGADAAERTRDEIAPKGMPPLDKGFKFTGPEFQFEDIPSPT